MKRIGALIVAVAMSACAGGAPMQPEFLRMPSIGSATQGGALVHAAVGFSVDTPQRAAIAAREGIASTILYNGAPRQGSALASALAANHISVIDGGIASDLYEWECWRTLTTNPPPQSAGYAWCGPSGTQIHSTAALLAAVKALLTRDARLGYVAGYWVLDDWPYWDYGSAHAVLQKIHAEIAVATPGKPAICGFAATVGRPGQALWSPGLARNYSNAACDAVGWYVYAEIGLKHPSSGRNLDWSMKALLPAMARSLERYGWQIDSHPLVGIGQAWSGSYSGGHYYQPGLSAAQMRAQAAGFCGFGASSISWYAWYDSSFTSQTQTPNDSSTIAAGVADGIAACKAGWAF